ncbi:hypothetical protein M0R36_09625 [bacterium]|jgi:hypothetical protein|nr:hypothetical protein [bacterium]
MKLETVTFFSLDEELSKKLNVFFTSRLYKKNELYLKKFKDTLELKEFLDKTCLEGNMVYFFNIGKKLYVILNDITTFKVLSTLVSICGYHKINLKYFNSWENLVIMEVTNSDRELVFYKDFSVNIYSSDFMNKLFFYVIPKKKRRRK